MKRTFFQVFVSAIFILFFPLSFVFAAQVMTATRVAFTLSNVCPPINNTGVSVSLSKRATQVVAGRSIQISGFIQNKNTYPIPDVSMIVELVKLAKNSGSPYDKTTDTVLLSNPFIGRYLSASSTSSFSITANIPNDLVSGQYSVEIFLNGSNQFAIGGDECFGIPAAVYPLQISGNQTQTSFFDLSSLKVNDVKPITQSILTPYNDSVATTSIVFISPISNTNIATTSIVIDNTYGTSSVATMSWYLFKGNSIDDVRNLVTTKTDQVALLPGKNNVVSFVSSNIVDARYVLAGILQDGNKESFFSVLIYRSDINHPMAQLLSLDSFPVVSGKGFIFGSFMRNNLATTTISLSLNDANGSTLWSFNHLVSTSSLISSFRVPFTLASKSSQSLTLSLETFDASGNITSSSSVSYVCNSTNCPTQSWSPPIFFYIIIILAILVLIVLIIYLLRLKKRKINAV